MLPLSFFLCLSEKSSDDDFSFTYTDDDKRSDPFVICLRRCRGYSARRQGEERRKGRGLLGKNASGEWWEALRVVGTVGVLVEKRGLESGGEGASRGLEL